MSKRFISPGSHSEKPKYTFNMEKNKYYDEVHEPQDTLRYRKNYGPEDIVTIIFMYKDRPIKNFNPKVLPDTSIQNLIDDLNEEMEDPQTEIEFPNNENISMVIRDPIRQMGVTVKDVVRIGNNGEYANIYVTKKPGCVRKSIEGCIGQNCLTECIPFGGKRKRKTRNLKKTRKIRKYNKKTRHRKR